MSSTVTPPKSTNQELLDGTSSILCKSCTSPDFAFASPQDDLVGLVSAVVIGLGTVVRRYQCQYKRALVKRVSLTTTDI